MPQDGRRLSEAEELMLLLVCHRAVRDHRQLSDEDLERIIKDEDYARGLCLELAAVISAAARVKRYRIRKFELEQWETSDLEEVVNSHVAENGQADYDPYMPTFPMLNLDSDFSIASEILEERSGKSAAHLCIPKERS